jgi:uncharacterized protein (DUF342 family)
LADFRELGEIIIVHANDALMRLIPPTAGDPGEAVTGEVFSVQPGKNIAFATKLDGVIVDPDDPNKLIAEISGCPVIVKNGVSVLPVYAVENVDLRTGNITFTGSVHVSGDVHAGMVIKATGDIHVDGTVENAVLEAGVDIVVKGGVIGDSKSKTSATIKCNGSFTARFVQHANISAGSGIFINDIAMLSELAAGHQIVVGDKGSHKGDIIGGVARATMLVKAHNFGSSSNIKTVVIVGADQSLKGRCDIATQAREASERKLADIIKLLEVARTSPARIPPEIVKTLGATRNTLNAEIETLREDEIELWKEIQLANEARVVAGRHVFAGTEISIGSKRGNVPKDMEGGSFYTDKEGRLVYV